MRVSLLSAAVCLLALAPVAAEDFFDDFERDDGPADGWFVYQETADIVDGEILAESLGGAEVWTWVDLEEPFRGADDVDITIEFDIEFDTPDSVPDVRTPRRCHVLWQQEDTPLRRNERIHHRLDRSSGLIMDTGFTAGQTAARRRSFRTVSSPILRIPVVTGRSP